jgi:glutamine amidotransferase
MKRRPTDDRQEIDVAGMASDVRADLVVGQVHGATTGALQAENTHPFRYRQWLFAQAGSVVSFDRVRDRLVATVPEFLRSGIRGDTDAEVLFHVFLSFIHDAGRLGGGWVDPALIGAALRSCLAVVDGVTAEAGDEPAQINLLVSNGDRLVAVHRSDAPMRIRVLSGKSDADIILGDDPQLRRKIPELGRMRFTLIASDFDGEPPNGRWKPMADCAIVTMSRDDEPIIEAI